MISQYFLSAVGVAKQAARVEAGQRSDGASGGTALHGDKDPHRPGE